MSSATAAACSLISGTAMISQKAPLVNEPDRPQPLGSHRPANRSSTARPMPSGSGRAWPSVEQLPQATDRRSAPWADSGPGAVEDVGERAGPSSVPPLALADRGTSMSTSIGRPAFDAPGNNFRWPRDQVDQRRPSGAIRCRWTSHQGRAWRRKRRCSSRPSGRPCHSKWLCGRSEFYRGSPADLG